LNDVLSQSEFSTFTGDWSLTSKDFNSVPEGTYELKIAGQAGNLVSEHTFNV